MLSDDRNVGIRLKDGRLIEVIYPLRIFREYETPWLDHKGSREMNIDPVDTLAKFRAKKDFSYGGRFIVAPWNCGGYGDYKKVVHVLPFGTVEHIEPLPADRVAIGIENARLEDEARLKAEMENPERYVRFKELKALEERIAKLEAK